MSSSLSSLSSEECPSKTSWGSFDASSSSTSPAIWTLWTRLLELLDTVAGSKSSWVAIGLKNEDIFGCKGNGPHLSLIWVPSCIVFRRRCVRRNRSLFGVFSMPLWIQKLSDLCEFVAQPGLKRVHDCSNDQYVYRTTAQFRRRNPNKRCCNTVSFLVYRYTTWKAKPHQMGQKLPSLELAGTTKWPSTMQEGSSQTVLIDPLVNSACSKVS